jgi:Na+/melibiose symporter-like transporter
VFAHSALVTGGAMLLGTVGGGLLGDLDLAIPFVTRAVLLGVVFVIAYITMHDIGYSPRPLKPAEFPAEMRRLARASIQHGWSQRSMRLLIVVTIIQSGFFAWGFYAWPPYFLELLGQDAVWVAGTVSALIALSTMLGNAIVEWFTRFCGRRTTFLLWAAGIQAVAVIGMGLVDSFWLAAPLFLLAMATTGVAGPVQQAYTHQIIPSEQRATIVSFSSMMGSGGSAVGQSGLGALAQSRSIAAGYVTGGLFTLTALPVLLLLRRQNDTADLIVGDAGRSASCAAQGLPSVTTLDTSTATSGRKPTYAKDKLDV